MIFLGSPLISLREAIARKAESEEEAHAIIQEIMRELDQTDWSELIAKKKAEKIQQQEKQLNTQVPCKRCKQKFKYRDLKLIGVAWGSGLYCETCFDRFNIEHTYNCPVCKNVYISEKFSTACPTCRIKDEKKESGVLQRHLRDAKKAGREATLKLDEWLATLQYFGGYCAYCQKQPYQVLEHFIPINPDKVNGGGTTVYNCVPACESCNRKKKNTFPDQMLRQSEFISITQLSNYRYGIDILTVERVWRYLDTMHQQVKSGWTFDERKHYHNAEATELWTEKKPEFRQIIMEILNTDE